VTEDSTAARFAQLSDDHRAFLEAQAVNVDLALSLGVRSLLTREDNPREGVWENWANFPAILFPWTNEEGRTEYQVRPDNPTEDNRGRGRKYVFRKGMTPVLWAVRPVPDAERIIIVEGTKQCLAAGSYAPPGVGVYGIAGCRMWQTDGQPIPDLMVADDREVVVILDADAANNPEVYQAGIELSEALAMEGATKVTFGRLPGGGSKSGLDDVLGSRPAARRADYLARIIERAKPKPADAKPTGKKKGQEKPKASDGRATIVVNRDRLEVINDLTSALLERWNAVELFNHGGVISRRRGAVMKPVDRGSFYDLVQETAITVTENNGANGTTYGFAWPDPGTMAATMSRADQFAPLDRISHAPFVREDGTVVTEPGYDEQTRTMLIPDPVLEGLTVPESPTPEEIEAARELLLTEWLGDFPFDSDVDRANVLALIVTPAIRGMVPKVPLAVIDGLQMGVGKNLLVDSILTVYTGQAAEPMNWVPEADELRKQITAAFRTGAEFFVFDEAHTIEGAPLAQALTASTWQDRILGVSNMANFPNVITWVSLGNQVQVRGDLTRRVYRIALRPRYANPQDRKAETFRHPGQSGLDLGSWTRKHRRELMTAILTLVRAWFAQGSPRPKRGVSFGSFEVWERVVGGILETAGLTGFLDNLKTWRSESDFDTQYWTGHLRWLRELFGDNPFRTAQVREKALADPAGYMAPPKLDDPSDKGYGKALGEAYSRLRGRRYGGLWIERNGSAHGHVSVWSVFEEGTDDPTGGNPGPEPSPPPVTDRGRAVTVAEESPKGGDSDNSGESGSVDSDTSTGDAAHRDKFEDDRLEENAVEPSGVVTFDLETGDAEDLYRADPATYVRLAGSARDDRPVVTAAGNLAAPMAVEAIRSGAVVTGHNVMAFDLPALVRTGVLTMSEVHRMAAEGRIFDALLAARYLDPPMARDKGVDATRKYDLGALGERYGLGEKLSDVSKALAKKYGGWSEIPWDVNDPDPARAADAAEFTRYMVQDVELSRSLYRALLAELGGTVPEYLVREHRVAALATQISVNGFRVDQELLTERLEEVNQRKAKSLAWLAEHAGVPLADAKGRPYKSPLASKAGKEALERALRAAGATSLWRTGKSQDLDTSGDHMRHLAEEYGHLPAVREIAKHVYRIVGARSVYQTLQDNLCPDGRVHPRIGFDQATGRWSVTSPGLTVLGKRGGRHVERAVLLPDPGEVLISADLSQVDMRAVAGLSQDQAYIEMLKHDDPHTRIAVELFGTAERREEAKAIGHGWNYGRGIRAISEGQDIDPALVRRFDTSMRERFPRLVQWQAEVRERAESGALLDNGFGRLMRPDPQRAHTQGPALMGQGAARDIMMTGLLRLPAEILPMLRAQIHDEIVLSVPAEHAEEIGRTVVDALSFEWNGVPILADVSRPGTDWSMCYAK
jgi:DNA polymerase I-like protein with 3'-5' exonuclease and polymerase domains